MNNLNINIETIEMNYIVISSENGAISFYDLSQWTIDAAVENYIEQEF